MFEKEFISLTEAIKYCNYSQEYLSLRARQGKLKAVKFGRNWVTKKEWLEEYLGEVKTYKNFKTKKFAAPPSNLPVGEFRRIQLIPGIHFGFIFILVFALLLGGITINQDFFKHNFEALALYIREINFEENVSDTIFLAVVNVQDALEITTDVFEQFSQWLVNKVLPWSKK